MAEDERVERVEDEIGSARSAAEEAGIPEDPDEPRLVESGDSGTIAEDPGIDPPAPPG